MENEKPGMPVVSINHVFFMRNCKTILNDISFCINPGEHWAIIGPNGSGKTSLISIINGYHRPSKGDVIVLNRRFGRTDLRELRRSIGECSSEIREMIHEWESIKDIVLSGKFGSIGLYEKPAPIDLGFSDELLRFFKLSELEDRPFRELSTGEQQKTIIARALMPGPRLLVLDEPCAGLDLRAREEVLDAVQKISLAPSPLLIYITHHIEEIIPGITHVMALKEGKVIACGSKKDVLTSEVISETFDVRVSLQEKNGRLWPVIVK
ncbi:MAG TPA: ABC transporter ATP-binding protein [Candidatus Methanoperedens sp.]